MDEFEDISYSEFGLDGRDLFMAEYSDIIFYFEDALYEPVYEKLISIICPDHVSSSVECLGGKTQVIKKAKTLNDIHRPRVFIVDKDFDDILDEKKDLQGLIYLDKYCLENYLISLKSIVSVLIDRLVLPSAATTAKCADFPVFYTGILERYETITRLFLVARKNRLSIATTGIPISEFVLGETIGDILPQEFIDSYKKDFLECASLEQPWITSGAILDNLLSEAFDKKNGDPIQTPLKNHFCGKHLFGFTIKYIEFVTGNSFEQISLASLYMDIMGRIDSLKEDLKNISSQISDTIQIQRENLH